MVSQHVNSRSVLKLNDDAFKLDVQKYCLSEFSFHMLCDIFVKKALSDNSLYRLGSEQWNTVLVIF